MKAQGAAEAELTTTAEAREPGGSGSAAPSPASALHRRVQRGAGNQAVQRMLSAAGRASGGAPDGARVQAKLEVPGPRHAEEAQADRIAGAVVSMPAPALCPQCAAHAAGRASAPCPRCRERLRRQVEGGGASASAAPATVTGDTEARVRGLGQGRPLPPAARAYFEPRFGRDFGAVRVHTGGQAAGAAQALGARAFTYGSDIAFAPGQFTPGSGEGRRLLAHELVHVVQQTGTPAGAETVHRDALDPANPHAWSFIGSPHRRTGWAADTYEGTLGQAPGASLELSQEIQQTGVPTTDDQKEEFRRRAETLVRLNALGLMASHRATIQGRQEEVLQSFANRDGSEEGRPSRAETLQAVRAAAAKITRMREVKEELEEFKADLNVVAAHALIDWYDLEEWGKAIYESTKRHRPRRISEYMRGVAASVQRRRPSRSMWRMIVHNMAEYLASWRQGQIDGIDAALYYVFQAFPFFAHLDAEDVADGDYATDEELEEAVREAFADLMRAVDDSIVQIGTNDIHPFNLPEAVSVTRGELSPELRPAFAEAIQEHQVEEFWWNFFPTLLTVALVFIPVVGPALAAAVGIASVAASVEDMMDRLVMSSAATDPDGDLLGVGAPSRLEWAMLALEVVLTAADLGMLARELRAGSRMTLADVPTHRELDEAMARSMDESPQPSGTRPRDEGDLPAPGRSADEAGDAAAGATRRTGSAGELRAGERELLERTGSHSGGDLSLEELNGELQIVHRRFAEDPELTEIDLGNGHSWRRDSQGRLCRHSNGDFCIWDEGSTEWNRMRGEFEGAPDLQAYGTHRNDPAHDMGVQLGQRRAEQHGLQDAGFTNPFEFHGRYGQGIDDIRVRNGRLYVVEYKGGTADLAEGQMSRAWVTRKITQMRSRGGATGQYWAEILEAALQRRPVNPANIPSGMRYPPPGTPPINTTEGLFGVAYATPSDASPTSIIGIWGYSGSRVAPYVRRSTSSVPR